MPMRQLVYFGGVVGLSPNTQDGNILQSSIVKCHKITMVGSLIAIPEKLKTAQSYQPVKVSLGRHVLLFILIFFCSLISLIVVVKVVVSTCSFLRKQHYRNAKSCGNKWQFPQMFFVAFVATLFYAKKTDLENKNACGPPERTNQLSFMRRSQLLQTLWFSASVNS